ncbi:MAG: hypothetical protein OXC07_08330, partial [Kistimonas sp.]|nr:hypothetical protein [Kistimonas sp.]
MSFILNYTVSVVLCAAGVMMYARGLKGVSSLVLIAVSLLAEQAVYAGENGVSRLRAPVYISKNCRPGVQMQAAVLHTAALSVASGPGNPQAIRQKVRQLPRSRRANKLPSWYKRAQAAALRSQSFPMQRLRTGPVQPSARVRIREPVASPASERSPARDLARQERGAASVTARSAPVRGRDGLASRPESRGTRHRRLVQESLDTLDTLDTMDEEMDWEAGNRALRGAPAHLMDDPLERPLGNENFTRAIKTDPFGHYRLVEPVVFNSTTDLPLSNATHPFCGRLTGSGANSLQLDLTRQEDGDLHLFGGLVNAFMDLSLKDSRLISEKGSLALFGGPTQGSALRLRVDNSELKAQGGRHAALVEQLEANNTIDLTMSDSNITLLGSSAAKGPLVAGPVARTVGRNNSLHVHDSSANRVEAQGQHSPVVASLGWGYLDFKNCTLEYGRCFTGL